MIDTPAFVAAMEQHWTTELRNVSSPALRQVWGQMGGVFNRHIAAHNNPFEEGRWTVLQPPTGSGKSQGTVVYCAMLSALLEEQHPGVLIVTRLKDDADAMAAQINHMSKRRVAAAFHSSATSNLADLWQYPVLVVTHRAYELALDHLGQSASIRQTWPYFHNRGDTTRALVVIDECLDIVEESQAGLEGLRQTLAAIPGAVRSQFPAQVAAIAEVIRVLEQVQEKSATTQTRETVLLKQMIDAGTVPDIAALRKALRDVHFDSIQLCRSDAVERVRLREIHDGRLRSLQHIFTSWVYYSKSGAKKAGDAGHTLNTARLLVPEGAKGCVVLDATAAANVIYQLFDKAEVIEPPEGVRCYRNVTLHVSRGHNVGKVYMRNNAQVNTAQLVGDLNGKLAGRKAFIACHKSVEPVLQTQGATFELLTGHWGAIDGANRWQDCSAAVIFGLPYRPDTWSANAFFSLRAEARPWGEHPDIRAALKHGQVTSDVVQAINRIRCRRVIDAEGNCPTADVYLLLPSDAAADDILSGILKEMPGIQVKQWQYEHARKKPKRSNYALALETLIRGMPPGRIAVSEVKRDLGISASRFITLAETLRDPGSTLGKTLVETGVRYEVGRYGKTNRAYFIRP
jgi:hypothetical protein